MKLYCEWCSDPKVQTLSEQDQRRHIMLMLLCKMGDLEKATDDDVAFFMRLPSEEWLATKERLFKRGLISCNDNGKTCIPTWEKRQGKMDHSTERVRKWRKEHTCPDCRTIDKEVQLSTVGHMVYCPQCLGET
jgi:hypothetical protein